MPPGWPPTRHQQHLEFERKRRAEQARERDAYLATLTQVERDELLRVAMEEAALARRFYQPKRQRTRAINRYGRHEERVAAWEPPTRRSRR